MNLHYLYHSLIPFILFCQRVCTIDYFKIYKIVIPSKRPDANVMLQFYQYQEISLLQYYQHYYRNLILKFKE